MVTLNEIKAKVIQVWESDRIILPSVTAAQFILESASGTSSLAKLANNFFGIKASAPWSGPVETITSNEEVDGKLVPRVSAFRKYGSWQESVQDHSDFFVSTTFRKQHYAAVIGETDYKKVCAALAKTYATDSSYGTKLIAIIEKNGLDAWDKGGKIMGKKIFIDDGHGGNDNGATGNGILEDAWNLEVCSLIESELAALGHQINSTRNTDIFIGLSDRAIMANNWGADIFISCHVNAGGGTGYEDFIYDGVLSSDGNTPGLQKAIHAAVVKVISAYGLKDRGMKRANYAVLRETYMPAILLEAGFLDNSVDAALLKNSQFKKDYAHAVAVGVQNYFGLSVSSAPAAAVSQVVRTRVPVTYNASVTAAGYSIDSAPWGEPGFEKWGMTDDILGNSIYVYEENESGEYVNAYQVGWIDKRGITREKQVVASIVHLPNGKNWTIYPVEGPYTAGDVISLEGANGESAYTVLGERNGGKVLVVELENFGPVGLYYDEDKGATIEKKYA